MLFYQKIKGGINMQEGHPKLGLYDSSYEHDNCGIGAVVNIKGEKSH